MRLRKYNKGLHAARYGREPEERRFANAWNDINNPPDETGEHTLKYLLTPPEEHVSSPVQPTDRDYLVAATVVQWLGSPVGQFFLQQLGYVRVEESKKAKNGRRP